MKTDVLDENLVFSATLDGTNIPRNEDSITVPAKGIGPESSQSDAQIGDFFQIDGKRCIYIYLGRTATGLHAFAPCAASAARASQSLPIPRTFGSPS